MALSSKFFEPRISPTNSTEYCFRRPAAHWHHSGTDIEESSCSVLQIRKRIYGDLPGINMEITILRSACQQPWAELIISGRKQIEIRNWSTNYRGDCWLHTGKKRNPELEKLFSIEDPFTGGFLGIVRLNLIITMDRQRWETMRERHFVPGVFIPGMYGWVISNARRFKQPVPGLGQLRLSFRIKIFTQNWVAPPSKKISITRIVSRFSIVSNVTALQTPVFRSAPKWIRIVAWQISDNFPSDNRIPYVNPTFVVVLLPVISFAGCERIYQPPRLLRGWNYTGCIREIFVYSSHLQFPSAVAVPKIGRLWSGSKEVVLVSCGITCVWVALWSGVAVVSLDDWHPTKKVIIKTPQNKIWCTDLLSRSFLSTANLRLCSFVQHNKTRLIIPLLNLHGCR